MLILDSKTIYLTGAGFVLIAAWHLLSMARMLPSQLRPSARTWAQGSGVIALSWLLFALDGSIPEFVIILFGNLGYLLGTVLLYQSLRLFDGLQPQKAIYLQLVVPVTVANLLARFAIDSFDLRVVIMSLGMAVPLGLAARHLLRTGEGVTSAGRMITCTWLVLNALILLARAIAAALFGAGPGPTDNGFGQSLILALALVTVAGLIFSFYLLYVDRSTTELRFQADRDPLTGLLNRRAFQTVAQREIRLAQLRSQPLSVLLLDADDFKRINDEQGHEAGDDALRAVAHALAANLRHHDVLARLGGDEFIALLPGIDVTKARQMADRLIESVRQLDRQLSVSVGAADLAPGHDLRQLIREADDALYDEKRLRDIVQSPV